MRYTTTAPIFAHLNTLADEAGGGARGRVLSRLGEYVGLIVGPLNMRPTGATLLSADAERVEVRVSSVGSHVLVVISAEGDLAAEVFFLRSLAQRQLPAPRLLAQDLECTLVPFTWVVLSHVAGVALDAGADEALMRLAARQAGRALRRMHQLPAPGYGRPQTTGRWPVRGWREALGMWLARREARPRAAHALGAERAAALWQATIEHAELACDEPRALHGCPGPDRVLVNGGASSVHLEALVRPGEIVGGDPLFDLAHALLPRHPAAFRRGVYEGYTSVGALDAAQERRLARLRLLLRVGDTLWRADALDLAALPALVDRWLAELAGGMRDER